MEQANRKTIIAVIVLGAFITSLSQTVMTSSLPKIMLEFNIHAGIGQWLTTIYLMFMGVMIPCTGFLMNNFSITKLYIGALSLFLVGSILAIFAPSFIILVIARVIQALGTGVLLPIPQLVTFRLYAPHERGLIMGIVGLSIGFSPAFGPALAGFMVDGLGWRSIFVLLSALALLAIVFAATKLPTDKICHNSKMDLLSVILSTITFGGLLMGATNFGNYGPTDPTTIIPLLAGIIALIFFSKRQLKMQDPFLELRVFQKHYFTLAAIILIFAYGSMLVSTMLVALYVQDCLGLSAAISGLVLLPGSLLMILLNPPIGKFFDKRGPFILVSCGLLFLSTGNFFLSLINQNTSLIYVGFIYSIRMLGVVSMLQPLATWAVNSVESKDISHGTAIINTVRQVGGAITSAFFVSIMTLVAKNNTELAGIKASLFTSALFVFACLIIVMITLNPKKRKNPTIEN